MNYSQSLEYIFSQLPMFHRIGAAAYKPDLGNITELCRALGDPQDKFRSVHVAGTNGKGSVSHMLASVFMESGLRTGLFTSPHLTDFRERIRVDGKMIPKTRVARFISQHRQEFETMKPSFFEMTAAMAFEYFRDRQVDVAVVETGLGGRLDSTNLITPVVSVITNISFDHRQFLGDTLEQIAGEKAGIVKAGIPVIVGESQPITEKVFRQKATEVKAPLIFADSLFTAANAAVSGINGTLLKMEIRSPGTDNLLKIISPLAGLYQVKNVITVLGTIRVMRTLGYDLPDRYLVSGIRKVVRNTGLKGRWEVIGKKPLIICDTGHNEGGIRELVSQIGRTPHHHLHFVFGAVADKDLTGILELLPGEATYYFCKAGVPRGLDASELTTQAAAAGLNGTHYPTVAAAFEAARKAARPDDLVFVGGSTFVVAEVL
jgi:dihydrofolate synthase / folylpolyglutamate synthase